MNILFLTNIPSPYMVDFLNELGKLCELRVIFERDSQSGRDKSWNNYRFINFNGVILKGIKFKVDDARDDQALCPQIIKYIKKNHYDFIIVANPCTPTGIIAIEYMKLRSIPFILQSEGGYAKDGKGLKEKFKKQVMSGAQLYFSTTKVNDEYFFMYGAEKEKIARYPFTSLFKKDILKEVPTIKEKQKAKDKLNISQKKMILTVGRFIPIKGFDTLFNVCKNLGSDVGIYIVGGKPTDEYIKLKNELELNNIYFVDFLSKEEMKEYYLAADLFVFPSRGDTWGLVINEAMSYGLPIISSNRSIAALALVKDYENGFIVPVDDVESFEDKIIMLLNNPQLCLKMARNNIQFMQDYTIEAMAANEISVLNKLINKSCIKDEVIE